MNDRNERRLLANRKKTGKTQHDRAKVLFIALTSTALNRLNIVALEDLLAEALATPDETVNEELWEVLQTTVQAARTFFANQAAAAVVLLKRKS
jgi:hypothetical protein